MKNYTIAETALKLRVSKKTILREIKRGRLTPQKVGRRYLISQKDLDRYILGDDKGVEETVKKYLSENKSRMTSLLQRLVAMPSITNKEDQELKLAEFLHDYLKRKGIRTNLYKAGTAVCVRASSGFQKRGILFDCPLDTTPVGIESGWTYPPFDGHIEAGKMYGRGTADCKAGMVAMIFAILALQKNVPEEEYRVELAFDGGEQDGSYSGMKLALAKSLEADVALIGYAGTGHDLGIGARGYHRYEIVSKGVSVHSGARGKAGVNAISNMASLVHELDQIRFPRPDNPLFSFGSKITVAEISGGEAINIVPDKCVARIDVRVTPDLSKKQVDEKLKNVILSLRERRSEAEFSTRYLVGEEGYVVDDTANYPTALKKVIKEITGKKATPVVYGPGNIGNLLFKKGIDSFVWGPKGGNVHSYDEYVELDSLVPTAQTYALSVVEYFKL